MDAARALAAGQMRRPRIGFVGTGWIGRNRMKAMLETGAVEAAAILDPSPECADGAAAMAPDVTRATTLDEILDRELDGVAIATPSALHADQAIRALEKGMAVFCQKPLGRTEAEVHRVIEAAREADRLLGVDMSYRFTEGMRTIRELVRKGELGEIYAAELAFHNAYGPDKPWFYDPAQSGGGCVMDLGVHLVDLAYWVLGFPDVKRIESALFADGERLTRDAGKVENYAAISIDLENGALIRIDCSWHLHAGRDALISATFHGTSGGAAFFNVEGSFYDFVAERFQGTGRKVLCEPPDAWGGRAAADWARRLAAGERFDPTISELEKVACTLDQIYRR